MQIAFHIGANCTDEDQLLKSLLRNANALLQDGVAVPGPGKYRSLVRETIQSLDGASPPPEIRDALIDAIVENDSVHRLVMCNDKFICVPNRIFELGVFYAQAAPKIRALHQLFPDDDIELFLTIRNPATFLQETLSQAKAATISEYLGLIRPEELRWSDVVRRIKEGAPDTPLTVWCNEDAPLLWERLMRLVAGVTSDVSLSGGLDLLSSLISADGMRILTDNLGVNPPDTDADLHDMIADVWEQYAIPDQVEDVIELAELDPHLVTELTRIYDDDLEQIAAMRGVRLLLPFS